MNPIVRDANAADLERITEIYNQTIVASHVSFDTDPYDSERRHQWWAERDPDLECIVAELDDGVIGVAYSSWYRPKIGYRSSVETTVVVDSSHVGRGVGTLLLSTLLDRLRTAGFHRAIAIVALPNDASLALHLRLGYRVVGTLSEVGRKLDRFWDTTILETELV